MNEKHSGKYVVWNPRPEMWFAVAVEEYDSVIANSKRVAAHTGQAEDGSLIRSLTYHEMRRVASHCFKTRRDCWEYIEHIGGTRIKGKR